MTRAAWALAAVLAIGCSGEADEPVRTSARPRATAERSSPPPSTTRELVRGRRSLMGTAIEISVDAEPAIGRPAIERALDEMERVEALTSEWRETSEISAINRAAGGEPVAVSPETFEVIEAGLQSSEWSEGAFDLSWAALRGLYLFQPGQERVPSLEEVRDRLRFVGYRDIEIDRTARTVRLRRAGMALGTGGIAKGYALDRAGAVLQRAGIENYMIFGGGQILTHGRRGDRPWRVGIQHPRNAREYIGFLELTDGSVATSGDYEHAFIDDQGTRWHHIIDLSTGLPARASVQVTLVMSSGLYADAIDNGCFVMGAERCLQMLDRIGRGAEAVIIDPELRVWTTPGLRDRIVWRVELEDGRLPVPRGPGG